MPSFENSRIEKNERILIESLTWKPRRGEVWLIIGPNGGGKSFLADALSGAAAVDGRRLPQAEKTAVVSLEAASALIEEERKNDDSDFIEGGVDIGRTVYRYLGCETEISGRARRIISLLGLEPLANRGLKYLSTGEIRRTLLAKAFLSDKTFLIFSDPFAGLDADSRRTVAEFIEAAAAAWKEGRSDVCPFLFMETRSRYETRTVAENNSETVDEAAVLRLKNDSGENRPPAVLIEMKNVTVSWDGETVLKNLTWTVRAGEHTLIRGPNGCGKTTLTELITGDNPQLYANDITLFGWKRGTGESIWEVKQKIGVVSYRLHLEYRMVGGCDLEAVVISGFHDSVGLYCLRTDSERKATAVWLEFGGFRGRENEPFSAGRAVSRLGRSQPRESALFAGKNCRKENDDAAARYSRTG